MDAFKDREIFRFLQKILFSYLQIFSQLFWSFSISTNVMCNAILSTLTEFLSFYSNQHSSTPNKSRHYNTGSVFTSCSGKEMAKSGSVYQELCQVIFGAFKLVQNE